MKRLLAALFLCAACGGGLVDHGGVDLQTVGSLQCTLPQQDCGGSACVSTDKDVNNCGTCGLVCATPQHSTSKCDASECGFTCNRGFFQCASQGCCPASALAAGGDTSCAVVDGTVQCWGSNSSGQLGVDSAPFSGTPVTVSGVGAASSVAVGLNHVCAIRAGTGEVVCWGSNLSQQLGAPGTGIVPVPGISGAQLLALGDKHSCAVTTSGVSCWGANESGQLGQGSFTSPLGPGAVTGLAGASSISAGSAFTCAVTSGALNCWGDGSLGQFGNGATPPSFNPVQVNVSAPAIVATGAAHACSIASGFLCWGFDSFGQVGDGKQSSTQPSSRSGPGVQNPSTVAAGREHTCAVSGAGAAFCWGSNVSGQLGIGVPVAVETKPVAVSGLPAGVQRLALGATHSCAQTADGAVYCWGNNGSGQAGATAGGTILAPLPVD